MTATSRATSPLPLWRVGLNVLGLVGVLVLNGLAGSGSLSGSAIGTIANEFPSYFLPAGYTFGIWSLIYLALTVFVIYQTTRTGRTSPAVHSVGFLWLGSCALNGAWIVTFSYRLFVPALVVMGCLLVVLGVLHDRVRRVDDGGPTTWDDLLVVQPFALYFAWISVAIIANAFQTLTWLGWIGLNRIGALAAIAMMITATAGGLAMLARRGAWPFPLVVAWALAGIGVRYADVDVVRVPSFGLAALSVVVLVGWVILRRGRIADAGR